MLIWIKFFTKKQKLLENGGAPNTAKMSVSKLKNCKYTENYLSFGFINNKGIPPDLMCVICGEILIDEAMVPGKIMRYLQPRSSHFFKKPL